jgi:hypothetical protein
MRMTEAEWLACKDPDEMVRALNMRWTAGWWKGGRPPRYQLFRLFACFCCRRLGDLVDDQGRQIINRLEAYASAPDPTHGGRFHAPSERKELFAIRRVANKYWRDAHGEHFQRNRRLQKGEAGAKYLATLAVQSGAEIKPTSAASKARLYVAGAVGWRNGNKGLAIWRYPFKLDRTELRAQAALLREIVGNPFRLVSIESTWRTSNVIALAQAIQADGSFDRMPILADALEDAGCDNTDILDHCRKPGEHVRGCWVVDLLLGKK